MRPGEAQSEIFASGLFKGRVALVTGGGTGLGKATALELARCGARVLIAGRRTEVLEAAAGEAETAMADNPDAGGMDWVAADVRDRSSSEQLVRAALERHGRLDVLVNNAGGQYFTPAELIATKGWRAVWRLNVEGMLNMSEAAFELALGPARAGTIVNVTLSPHHGMPGMAHSGAARATVEALTRELAERWHASGVCATAGAAGPFLYAGLIKDPEPLRAATAPSVPPPRPGHAPAAATPPPPLPPPPRPPLHTPPA